MRTRFLRLLCVLALCLTLLPATAGAAGAGPDWTYDPGAQTLTSGDNTVTLYNVTAGGSSGTELTIGKNGSNSSGPMFNDNTLDLSGTITGTDGTPQYTTPLGTLPFTDASPLPPSPCPREPPPLGTLPFSNARPLPPWTCPAAQIWPPLGTLPFTDASPLPPWICPAAQI